MIKSEVAILAIRKAVVHVSELRAVVDPGHVPMITYLGKLRRKLQEQADELESRCRRESGEA